ncbi:EPIDERMAL PATTERNING FACTOR-like protein 2 [Salvia miltiorrhiza]|uniref:EPIDERMAL PATTERNING FACTOR-like protein 2 n=1 Tax=Salvia miltiorrhiza TaxID=226208 RepID=UPI0025ABFF3E|nr:EPIDERMAL PATTERNING FACTOR-like protein 2 [Salvia miltiorrhiza]
MACMIHYLLALELLLSPTLNPLHFMAQGRQLPDLRMMQRINEEKVMKMVAVIGSKPPRCDNKRCKSCGECEAVQVPIVPSKEFISQKHLHFHPIPRINIIAYSRGDYISNYKPMCWKCKCGDSYFNPGGA